MKIKRAHEKAVRTTVSMPPHLHEMATERVRLDKYSAFSDYIQELNKRASIGGQVIEVAQDDDGSPYLRLRGREGSYYGVKCRFATEAAQKLLNLKPGNKVAVHGTIEGSTGTSGDVVVVDCRLP